MIRKDEYVVCICDQCTHQSRFRMFDAHYGWVYFQEEQLCPNCNPFLSHSSEPNPEKLQKIIERKARETKEQNNS